ncbi:MAG: adenosine deaminase [Candidatus Poribacteria bacterium]|nr:adenosine deaminase [Candidatus Poribacteria bacterium]
MSWHDSVPKVELHVHLEGSIPHVALWEILRKYGGDPSVPTLDSLRERFEYRDFPHFLRVWMWKHSFLREYDDFTCLSEAVARDFARQNIRYAEVFYSPTDARGFHLEIGRLTEAIRVGLDRVPEIRVDLVADLVRNMGPDLGRQTLDAVAEVREFGVIGIGIGGSEHLFPPGPFADVYDKAREYGFRTSVHAGEAAGADSVRNAIRALNPDRIGHGTRAVEDPSVMDELAERQIPVELCPISNVRTNVVPSIEAHPARRFFERGIPISVNTDDPAMFGNSLADEYRALEGALGFSRDETRAVILSAVETSWLPDSDKRLLAQQLVSDPHWLG